MGRKISAKINKWSNDQIGKIRDMESTSKDLIESLSSLIDSFLEARDDGEITISTLKFCCSASDIKKLKDLIIEAREMIDDIKDRLDYEIYGE